MRVKFLQAACTTLLLITALSATATGTEDFNDCRNATGEFCERHGSCSIQGSDWYQYVTIDKNGIFDTQGWPGLCDMVHVSLVQGDCSPPGGQVDVTANLSPATFADIPSISGGLVCGAEIDANGDLAPWENPDGLIGAADLLIAMQLVLGQRTAGSLQYAYGDMNQDGVIDLADLLLIQKTVLK